VVPLVLSSDSHPWLPAFLLNLAKHKSLYIFNINTHAWISVYVYMYHIVSNAILLVNLSFYIYGDSYEIINRLNYI
jgi:hypothetical protein